MCVAVSSCLWPHQLRNNDILYMCCEYIIIYLVQILKHAAKRSAEGKAGQKENGRGKGNLIRTITSYNRIIQIPIQSFVRLRGTQKWDYDGGDRHNLLLVLSVSCPIISILKVLYTLILRQL